MSTGHHRRPTLVGRATELRNLDAQDARQLGQILDTLDGWQLLMEHIPRAQRDAATFVDRGEFKYTYDDICKIKEASLEDQPYNAAQILFDEWGTSGRVRPTLGHLLQLLVEVQLYRAADFLAVDILKEDPPARPAVGIAARVDISLLPISKQSSPTHESPSVPASANVAAAAAAPALNNNGPDNGNRLLNVPLIQVQQQSTAGTNSALPTRDGPNMNRTGSKAGPSLAQKVNDHLSDFIQFSQALQQQREAAGDEEVESSGDLPDLSVFGAGGAGPVPLSDPVQQSSEDVVPMLSMLQPAADNNGRGEVVAAPVTNHSAQIRSILQRSGLLTERTSVDHEVPALSMLMLSSQAQQAPEKAQQQSQARLAPAQSYARPTESDELMVPDFSLLQRSGAAEADRAVSSSGPALSALMPTQQSSSSLSTDSM